MKRNNIIFKKIIFVLTAIFMLASCNEMTDLYEGARPVKFWVTASQSFITEGESITFNDSSVNVKSRVWTFEGGSITTSTEKNPVVVYSTGGVFKTKVTSEFNDGTKEDRLFLITVRPPVVADFSADKQYLKFGNTVTFSSLATQIDYKENNYIGINTLPGYKMPYKWEFEGGVPAMSNLANPTVLYSTPGVYKVKLKVYRNIPADSSFIEKVSYINVLLNDVISPSNTLLAQVGSKIHLNFAEDMAALPVDAKSNFTVMVAGSKSDFSIALTSARRIVITPTTPITEGQSVSVKYAPGSVKSVSNKILAPQDLVITNNVVNLLNENSGFEKGNLDNWTSLWDNPAEATWNVVSTAPNSGNYCLRFNPLASGRHKINITCKPGLELLNKKFRLQFSAKASESNWTGGFALVWKKGANPYIEGNQNWWENGSNSNWAERSFDITFTAPGWAGTDEVNISFNTDGCKTERYLDDVKFYEVFE